MKITVEINDQTLHAAIEAQLGQAVASITDELIRRKVNEIVDKKLSRVGDADVEKALNKAAHDALMASLKTAYDNDHYRKEALRKVLSDAAVTALKGALK